MKHQISRTTQSIRFKRLGVHYTPSAIDAQQWAPGRQLAEKAPSALSADCGLTWHFV
jgi:hypothetical protein